MKKILLIGILCSLGATVMAEEINKEYTIHTRVGVGVLNDYSMEGTSASGDNVAQEVSVEVLKNIKQNIQVGLGFGYNNLSDGKTKLAHTTIGEYEGYKSYPIYTTVRYSFPVVGDGVTPYVKADLGYAFNGDMKYELVDGTKGKVGIDNGLYVGIGAGIEQNNITVDAMMKVTNGDYNGDSVDNYRFMLSVGYDFDFNLK